MNEKNEKLEWTVLISTANTRDKFRDDFFISRWKSRKIYFFIKLEKKAISVFIAFVLAG